MEIAQVLIYLAFALPVLVVIIVSLSISRARKYKLREKEEHDYLVKLMESVIDTHQKSSVRESKTGKTSKKSILSK